MFQVPVPGRVPAVEKHWSHILSLDTRGCNEFRALTNKNVAFSRSKWPPHHKNIPGYKELLNGPVKARNNLDWLYFLVAVPVFIPTGTCTSRCFIKKSQGVRQSFTSPIFSVKMPSRNSLGYANRKKLGIAYFRN